VEALHPGAEENMLVAWFPGDSDLDREKLRLCLRREQEWNCSGIVATVRLCIVANL
jgi:hypothetical protein